MLKYHDFKTNSGDFWTAPQNIYKITTAQKTFTVSRYRLDYKKTIANLKAAGYTDINITYLGKNVTFI